MKKVLIIFILFITSVFSETTLKDKLKCSGKGDYIVTKQNKIYSIISIFEKTENNLVIEEVTIPVKLFDQTLSFKEWFEKGAKRNSSWMMYELNLENSDILECFSFSKGAWLNISKDDAIFSKLLNLPLKALAKDQMRKIGPPPMPGEKDYRAVWYPQKIMEGKKIERPSFEVYRIVFPRDYSDLSEKTLDLYLDKDFSLPYWLQIGSDNLSVVLKTVDSGKNLKSPKSYFPRRHPQFISYPILTENNLILKIRATKYYNKFKIYALDITNDERMIHPISFNQKREKDVVTFEIEKSFLNNLFEKGHQYIWTLTSEENRDIYCEIKKPFLWDE